MIINYHVRLDTISLGDNMIIKAAERIKALRENTGMTQTELAKRISVTRSGVNAWEMGISLPSTNNLIELSLIFHVSIDYILGIENEDKVSLDKLSEKEKSLVRELIACFDKNSELRLN